MKLNFRKMFPFKQKKKLAYQLKALVVLFLGKYPLNKHTLFLWVFVNDL